MLAKWVKTLYCMILGCIHCAIMYAILLILDVDQKDRSLWERKCYFLRNRPLSPLFYLILPRKGFLNKRWTINSAFKDDNFVPRARRFFCSRGLSLKIGPSGSEKGKGTDDGFQRVTAILSMHQHNRPATNNLLAAQDTQDIRLP